MTNDSNSEPQVRVTVAGKGTGISDCCAPAIVVTCKGSSAFVRIEHPYLK